MKYGAVFPTNAIGDDPVVIRDFAQAAEDLGYAHILVYDHPVGASPEGRDPLVGPYTEKTAFHEPFVLMSYLAAATRRIGLATGVVILPQRQTALVAKQAAEVQNLSGGRLRLGVGTGWNPIEYETLGVDYEGRGARFDEQLHLLPRFWSEPLIDFTGRFHRIDRACINPHPHAPIPVWLGGMSAPAYRRAVESELAEGFIFPDVHRPFLEAAAELLERRASAGRDTADFGVETMVNYIDGPDGWARAVDRWSQVAPNGYMTLRTLYPMHIDKEDIRELAPAEHVGALEAFMREMRR